MPTNRSTARRARRSFLARLALVAGLAATSTGAPGAATPLYPDILAATVHARSDDRFDFDVRVSSPYDTPQRYADAFRVLGKDGAVFGERILDHDHQNEQPFTRDLHGVKIPGGVRTVVIQGRDQRSGYGGKTIEVALPGR